MLARFRYAVNHVVNGSTSPTKEFDVKVGDNDVTSVNSKIQDDKSSRFPYSRPDFLNLTAEEVQVSADHSIRPILVPRDILKLPWCSGYSEVINGGKSKWNEDQARAGTFFVRSADSNENHSSLSGEGANNSFDCDKEEANLNQDPLPFTYFGMFDGHAGTGAAIMAANMLHNFLQERLINVRSELITKRYALDEATTLSKAATNNVVAGYIFPPRLSKKVISADELIVGALEASFFDMDNVIKDESVNYRITGGCTAVVALFFMGKLYVANAGDSRAVMIHNGELKPLSEDFTPESERKRLQYLAKLKPELLHDEFTRLQFAQRVTRKHIGQQMLYRDAHMNGWAHKTVEESDCRLPLIYGEGKRARVLATIGVTRGFGDHNLTVLDTGIQIKPFLSPEPEVRIVDMSQESYTENDVVIIGTDGLWDVIPNLKALEIVSNSLAQFELDNQQRYTSAAQDLVIAARGLLKKSWKTVDDLPASYDDISCFVIPLHKYTTNVTRCSSTESSIDNSVEQL